MTTRVSRWAMWIVNEVARDLLVRVGIFGRMGVLVESMSACLPGFNFVCLDKLTGWVGV